MKYSLIVPVYNRPNEVDELLESLSRQTERDFEVVIVEDGSSIPCDGIIAKYRNKLASLLYFTKDNSGPSGTRNFGAEHAHGEYLIFLDSDAVLPESYMAAVSRELDESGAVCFGGPDRAHASFTPVQKAINYAMTSFFTTGGIRGGKKKLDKFYPRSFNMGIRADVFKEVHGFNTALRFGEDIDFSTRVIKGGYKTRLFPSAWVWHKRRTDFRKFFKQVCNSGIARITLYLLYPDTLKLVHLLPAVFTAGVAICLLAAVLLGIFAGGWWWIIPLAPLVLFALLIGIDSTVQNKSLKVGMLSIPAAYIQLTGYGSGFLRAWWKRLVMKKGNFTAFEKNFYK